MTLSCVNLVYLLPTFRHFPIRFRSTTYAAGIDTEEEKDMNTQIKALVYSEKPTSNGNNMKQFNKKITQLRSVTKL